MRQIRTLPTSWGIIWHMTGLNMLIGAGISFLYGPIAQLALVVVYAIQQGMGNSFYGVDMSVLFPVLMIASMIGLSSGFLIGLFGGILAGITTAVILPTIKRLPNVQSRYVLLYATSAIIGGLVTLIMMVVLNLPSRLAYLGVEWVVIGWVLLVAVPVVLFSIMFWRISRQVVKWSANRDWGESAG